MTAPLALGAVRGQPRAVAQLRALADQGPPVPPLLFAGPEGVGKRTAALAFAATLVCRARRNGDACGTCPACRRIAGAEAVTALRAGADAQGSARVYPDAGLVSIPAKRTRISVAQARDIAQSLSQHPFELPLRVYIIDPADRMTPAGLNALLKTLEEPPDFALLVLVTASPGALPVTVRSRLRTVRFGPLPAEEVARILEASGLPAEEASGRAALAGGSVARALSGEVERMRAQAGVWCVALERLATGAPAGLVAVEAAQQLAGSAVDAEAAIATLLVLLRDLASGRASPLCDAAVARRLTALARDAVAPTADRVRPIETLRAELTVINRNPRLAVEGSVLALAGLLPRRLSAL